MGLASKTKDPALQDVWSPVIDEGLGDGHESGREQARWEVAALVEGVGGEQKVMLTYS